MPSSYSSPYKNPALPDGPPGEHLDDGLADSRSSSGTSRAEAVPALSCVLLVDTLEGEKRPIAKYKAKGQSLKAMGRRFRPEGDRQANSSRITPSTRQ